MARHTSLYQSPRSPLIQGRMRVERPLWQAWVGGCGLGAFAVGAWYLVVSLTAVPAWFVPGLGWLAFAVVAGSGLGTIVSSVFGWRLRWPAAAGVSLASVWIAAAALSALAGR